MRRIIELILLVFCAMTLIMLGTLSAIASLFTKFGKQQQRRKHKNYLEEIDSLFKVRSPDFQDAVNLSEDEDKYICIFGYREWYNYNL
jgi:hypothetical protein